MPEVDAARDRSTGRRRDIAAGVTVGAMLVPQSMAYAALAGLPPEVGLYASVVPLLAYALIGTSRQLAVGPVAIVSLLTASAVGGFDDATALTAAAVLSLMVGATYLLMGVARLGFLVRLLSHAVLVGFTSAAALIIGVSQLPTLLGVKVGRNEHFHDAIWDLGAAVSGTHLLTLGIGLVSLAVLVLCRRYAPMVPGALLAVILATTASAVFGLEQRGVRVVGDIPSGLPGFVLPGTGGLDIVGLIPAALAITLVGYMESIAVAKVYARRNRYELDANRELFGLGLANVGSGMLGGLPVAGGFGRTAVNAEAGAQSRWAAVISAAIVALSLVALTPVVAALPSATLAAIVLAAIVKLFDLAEIEHVRHLKSSDFITLAVAFVATLGLGVELGIAVAVVASLLMILIRMMTPHTAVLGRLPGTDVYRNIDRHPHAEQFEGVAIIRFDVSLSYLNVDFFKQRVMRLVDARPGLETLVLDCAGINDIDTSATQALVELVEDLDRRDIVMHLTDIKGPVRDMLARAGLDRTLAGHLHDEVRHAIDSLGCRGVPGTSRDGGAINLP